MRAIFTWEEWGVGARLAGKKNNWKAQTRQVMKLSSSQHVACLGTTQSLFTLPEPRLPGVQFSMSRVEQRTCFSTKFPGEADAAVLRPHRAKLKVFWEDWLAVREAGRIMEEVALFGLFCYWCLFILYLHLEVHNPKQIREVQKETDKPINLVGDFNTPSSVTYRVKWQKKPQKVSRWYE